MKKYLIHLTLLAALLGSHAPAALAQPSYAGSPVAQATSLEQFQSVGPLYLGMSEDEVQDELGVPDSDTEAQLSQVTGLYTKDWLFPEKGIGVTLEAELPTGPYKVASILIEEPCTLSTVSGISIGMSKSEAEQRLRALIGDEVEWFGGDTEDKLGVLQTSTYTVLAVGCSEGKVKHIYIGPGPE